MTPAPGPPQLHVGHLFSSEATLRLSRLTEGLGRLLGDPAQPGLIDGLVSDARSLKGAATALRFDDVAHVAGGLHGALSSLGTADLPGRAVIEALLATVDALQAMVDARLADGEASALASRYRDGLVALASDTALAARPSVAAPPTDSVTLVQFDTGLGTFAVRAEDARHVLAVGDLRALPGAQHGVAGVVEYAGQTVPVLDALGHEGAHVLVVAGLERLFGLLVERVGSVFDVDPSSIEPAPGGQRVGLVGGVVHRGAALVMIIDVPALAIGLEPRAARFGV